MAMGALRQIGNPGNPTSANLQTPLSAETINSIDNLVLHVKNTAGSSMTVTFNDPGTTPSGTAPASNVTAASTVPATTGDVYINVPQSLTQSNGLIQANFSTTTSVTAEWLRGA